MFKAFFTLSFFFNKKINKLSVYSCFHVACERENFCVDNKVTAIKKKMFQKLILMLGFRHNCREITRSSIANRSIYPNCTSLLLRRIISNWEESC